MEMKNIIDIKVNNTYKIIEAIRFHDGLTKKDIVSDSGLSFATVSNICRDLRDNGIISETQTDDSEASIGRSPRHILLNYNEFFGVCLDMHSRDKMALAITNLRNEIVIKKEIVFGEYDNLKDFLEFCFEICTSACSEVGIDKKSLLGVCAAVPAIYDYNTGLTVGSGIALFEKQPFKALMEEIFDLPTFVDNESNISSMSITLNNAKNANNLIYLFCSEGLGIGVISDGKQIVGCGGYASEVCHIPIGNPKLTCRLCGCTGCVESDLSVAGFITKYLDYAEWDKKNTDTYWKNFLKAVESGEQKAIAVVNENAEILGKLTSILINLFEPEIMCFGGDVSVLFALMKPIIEAEVTKRLIVRDVNPTQLIQDSNENTIIYGCSEIIYNRINFTTLKKS